MPTLTTDVRDALRERFRAAFGNRLHQLIKEATEDGLNRARKSLNAARLLLENANDPNSAISSAYYAMLYAARAALNEAGKAPKSHQGVQHELRETYVQTGQLDAHYQSMLSQAERMQTTS